MYFSNRKLLRRILGMTCTVCLLATLFAGCGLGGEDETVPSTETQPGLNLDLNTTPTVPPTTLPAPTETQPEINENTGTVLSNMAIRSNPLSSAPEVGTLFAGDRIEIQRRTTSAGVNWAYIISPESGWIVMDYVQMDMEQDPNAGPDTSTPAGNDPSLAGQNTTGNTGTGTGTTTGTATNIQGVITAGELRIRSEASTNGTVQGSYKKGDKVTILETKGDWGRTNRGWISLDYVDTTGTTNNTGTNTNTNTGTNSNITSNGSTTVQFRGIVTAQELNIRPSASTQGNALGNYKYGARVEILEVSGNWGRTSKGWISLSYVYRDGNTGTNTASGTITATELRVRSGPGTDYGVVGSYKQGDSVNILEQFTYNGVTWGCTNKGWISMEYVNTGKDTSTGGDSSAASNPEASTSGTSITGTVTGNGLRVRSGPGTNYGVVGSVANGTRVTITRQSMDGNNVTWGYIGNGWISLQYVNLD